MGKLNVQCFTCANTEICKFKEEYAAIIAVLDKAEVNGGLIRNIPWINQKVECQYMKIPFVGHK